MSNVNAAIWQALSGVAYHERNFPATRHYSFVYGDTAILSHVTAGPVIPNVIIQDNRITPRA